MKTETHTNNCIARVSFSMIKFMHANFLLKWFRNPFHVLQALGLKKGQKVLEVGCGPGFFTFPAAQIVGSDGCVYALDVNPFAVKYIFKKIQQKGVANVEAHHANAAETNLPGNHIDLAFFIGVPHVAGGLQPVLSELNRVLKPNGEVSFHLGRWSEEALVGEMDTSGFELMEDRGSICVFRKRDPNGK